MSWVSYPDSPYGDVEICEHGNTREPGDTRKICLHCDYPPGTKFEHLNCKVCNPLFSTNMTVHLDGKCLRCECRENGLLPDSADEIKYCTLECDPLTTDCSHIKQCRANQPKYQSSASKAKKADKSIKTELIPKEKPQRRGDDRLTREVPIE